MEDFLLFRVTFKDGTEKYVYGHDEAYVAEKAEKQYCNSKDFGVPQNRERVFIIASLRGAGGREVFPVTGENGEVAAELKELTSGLADADRIYDGQGLARTLKAEAGGGGAKTGWYAVPVASPTQYSVNGEGIAYNLDANYAKGTSVGDIGKGRRTHIVQSLTERRTEEARRIRRENMKIGRDFAPRRGKEIVPREDGMANCVTATQTVEQLLLEKPTHIPGPDGINNTIRTGGKGSLTAKHNYEHVHDGYRIRKLTPRECWRLQGFPDWAFDRAQAAGVSDSQLYKQAGNSVTCNVIYAIAKHLR